MADSTSDARQYAQQAEAARTAAQAASQSAATAADSASRSAALASSAADAAARTAAADAALRLEAIRAAASEAAAQAASAATESTDRASASAGSSRDAADSAASAAASATSASASASDAAQAARSAADSATDIAETADLVEDRYQAFLAVVSGLVVGPVSGVGITRSGNVVSVTWTDPADVTLQGTMIARWSATRLVAKTGGFPEDQDDGETLVETTERNAHRLAPFVHDMGSASDYRFALFTKSHTGQWNTGDEAARFVVESDSLGTFLQMLRAGTIAAWPGFSVGMALPWTLGDTWDVPWRVAHVDYAAGLGRLDAWMEDSSKTHNLVLVPSLCPMLYGETNALQLQYDAPESAYGACDHETFMSGYAYYRFADDAYSQLVAGEDYQVGDAVAEFGEEVYLKNHNDRVQYGCNSWKMSNIRHWLNASGTGWYEPQNPFDQVTMNRTAQGFMTGMDATLLSAVQSVRNTTVRNTVAATRHGGGGGFDVTSDRVWLLSQAEVFGTQAGTAAHEGEQLDLYSQVLDTAALRIMRDRAGTARDCWLRSPSVFVVRNAMYVSLSGTSIAQYCSFSKSFLPAICIA